MDLSASNERSVERTAVVILDPSDRVAWHNAPAGALFGRQTLAGESLAMWLAPRSRGFGEAPIVPDGVRAHPNGLRRLEVEISELPQMGKGYRLAVLHDADREERIRREMRMLARAVGQSGDAVLITDARGIIEYVNPAFEASTGYRFDEAVGRPSSLLNSGRHNPEFFDRLWETIRKGDVFRAVFTNRRKDGAIFFEEKTISPIRNANGSITHYVSTAKDVTERVEAEARLEYLANYDQVTDLPNRSLFADRLRQALRRGHRDSCLVALMFLDLDRFKLVNDSLGHSVGDRLLRQVGERIAGVVRDQDTVARIGGDEFTLVLEDLHAPEDADHVAGKVLEAFAAPFVIDDRTVYLGISIGIACHPNDGDDVETLLKHADIAMYRAKGTGRSTRVFYNQVMSGTMLEDLGLEASLRTALDRREFRVVFQPIADAFSWQIVAVEALLRWESPEHGTVGPARFVPILEETGLIVPVGSWVLREACRQMLTIQSGITDGHRLAVNISGRQFRQPDFVADVTRALAETGMDPRRLELEITESVLIENAPIAAETLRSLKSLGIRLAIDDFGTGYSSLSYLRRFPLTTLKIDRSFIADIEDSADAVAIVRAVVNLAHSLGLEVVAEGIENERQLGLTAALGCRQMQGYWFGRPTPLAEVMELRRAPESERREGEIDGQG